MKACVDFANSFVNTLMQDSKDYHQVRLISDKYIIEVF